MSGIVRKSKFRNTYGSEAKKEFWYENIRPSNCAFDGTFIACNGKFVAFCVEVGGAGAFTVIPVSKAGRLDTDLPKVSAHREYILDIKWNPFDDSMLATSCEDGSIRLWQFSDHGVLSNMDESKALLSFQFHQRRCTQISWHPIVENVLMSVSQEPQIAIWNLDTGEAETVINAPKVIHFAEWSIKGDKIVTTDKEKMIRIYDARSGKELMSCKGHEGQKPQRVVFTFDDTMLFSCGFSKMSERQYAAWSVTDKIKQLDIGELDSSNGTLNPIYDPDTQMVYVVAKGDSVIRYYELVKEDPYFHYITTFQSKDVQKGFTTIPKRCVDVNSCEVMKFYKIVAGSGNKPALIKPISFTVPRKSELYQDDLYPDAISNESSCDEPSEWFSGTNFEPKRISMSQFFKGAVTPSSSAGGGLKKGGLKGLKAKKESKAAGKPAAAPSPTPSEEKSSPTPAAKSAPVSSAPSASSPAPSSGGVDKDYVAGLEKEIKGLKVSNKEMEKEIKSLNDKLKDFDKLSGDVKLLCDAVKKNNERLTSLEALVEEGDDEE